MGISLWRYSWEQSIVTTPWPISFKRKSRIKVKVWEAILKKKKKQNKKNKKKRKTKKKKKKKEEDQKKKKKTHYTAFYFLSPSLIIVLLNHKLPIIEGYRKYCDATLTVSSSKVASVQIEEQFAIITLVFGFLLRSHSAYFSKEKKILRGADCCDRKLRKENFIQYSE